jgi:hypothetical protein
MWKDILWVTGTAGKPGFISELPRRSDEPGAQVPD